MRYVQCQPDVFQVGVLVLHGRFGAGLSHGRDYILRATLMGAPKRHRNEFFMSSVTQLA
jgi:hypothetical protein